MFPFLKLPSVAQICVVQYIPLHRQFFLGLCSKRTEIIVRRVHRKCKSLVINVIDSCIQLPRISSRRKGLEVLFWVSEEGDEDFHKEYSNKEKRIKLEYMGLKIRCCISFHPKTEIPLIRCMEKYKGIISVAIHDSMSRILRMSRETTIMFSMDRIMDFPDIDTVDNLYENSESLSPELYRKFFDTINIRNSLKLETYEDISLPADHKIFSIPHVFIEEPDWITREHLINFQGISATFQELTLSGISTDDLVAFVDGWKQGNNKNLESMVITLNSSKSIRRRLIKFDEKLFWANFEEAKPWDPRKRGGRFYNQRTAILGHSTDLLDCTDKRDIQRESDRLLATIHITEDLFCFFVWTTPFPDPLRAKPINTITTRFFGKEPRTEVYYYFGAILF